MQIIGRCYFTDAGNANRGGGKILQLIQFS